MDQTLRDESTAGAAVVPIYEDLLSSDSRWALAEGSRHFDEESAVFAALTKIAKRLDEIGVTYAVVDGMALFQHGYRRFTEDVDVLVSRDDLKAIHEKLEGLGYLRKWQKLTASPGPRQHNFKTLKRRSLISLRARAAIETESGVHHLDLTLR